MDHENYVGRCPHCGVITAAVRMPLKAKEVGRFAENCAKLGLRFGVATIAECRTAGPHVDPCPRWTPKVARRLKLEDST